MHLVEPAARAVAHLAYRGAAVCGMCALALEVMWTRAVSLSVGTTTYSFTVMLASFLTGIWLGSWLHAALPVRRVSAALQLGLVMVTIGVTSLVVSFWIPRLPELVVALNVAVYGVVPRIHNLTTLVAGLAVMLVPCIFMGISFPLAGEARLGLVRAFGRSAGDTIGWNTLGSIGLRLGLISLDQIDQIISRQASDFRRFGEIGVGPETPHYQRKENSRPQRRLREAATRLKTGSRQQAIARERHDQLVDS